MNVCSRLVIRHGRPHLRRTQEGHLSDLSPQAAAIVGGSNGRIGRDSNRQTRHGIPRRLRSVAPSLLLQKWRVCEGFYGDRRRHGVGLDEIDSQSGEPILLSQRFGALSHGVHAQHP